MRNALIRFGLTTSLVAVLLLSATVVEAAQWHWNNGFYRWSVMDPICKNGVEITLADFEEAGQEQIYTFDAYILNANAPKIPIPVSRNLNPKLKRLVGSARVEGSYHEVPLQVTDDDTGESVETHWYGQSALLFEFNLPVGTSIAISRDGLQEYFVGQVVACTVS